MENTFGPSVARVAELETAFNRVVNKSNWKNPIDTIVTVQPLSGELDDIREAVIFYTGSVCKFSRGEGDRRIVRVQAAGYYATIGA